MATILIAWLEWAQARARGSVWARSILWIGLIICGVALFKSGGMMISRFAAITWLQALAIIVLLYSGWILSVASWRQVLIAWTGNVVEWRRAIRQSAYLLIGKYLPGGIFGFLARLADHEGADRAKAAIAGMTEQAIGVGIVTGCGLILYAAARLDAWLLLLLLPALVPLVARGAGQMGSLLFSRLKRNVPPIHANRESLSVATWLALGQQIATLTMVILLAVVLFDISPVGGIAVAGAFALSVGAGTVVFLAPGGIGVREAVMVVLALPWLVPADGVALASLLRILSICLDLSAGVVAVLLLRIGKVG